MSLKHNLDFIAYPHSDQLRTEQIAAQNTGSSFLRPVIHGIPKNLRDRNNSLTECLSAIDEHLQYLAIAIGGQVVNHRWVLTSDTAIRSKAGSHAHSDGLAMFDQPGVWLGAIVDWVPGIPIATMNGFNHGVTNEAHLKLRDALDSWKKLEGWSTLPGELTDSSQFLSSTSPDGANFYNINPVLVDIDII